MRRAPAIAAVLLLAGCGGGKSDLVQSARPCLEKLGPYLHHVPRPSSSVDTTPRLPVVDPSARTIGGPTTPQLLPWPEDFQEYGEISFTDEPKGANAVQILIFGDEELPKRVVAASRSAATGGLFFPGRVTQRLGRTLVIWSSRPTARQRAAVDACVSA